MVITARGKKDGNPLTVVCSGDGESFSYAFNGAEDIPLKVDLEWEANKTHPIGGTYFPETMGLKLVSALTGWFFDMPPDIDVDGEIEQIPYEDGIVY